MLWYRYKDGLKKKKNIRGIDDAMSIVLDFLGVPKHKQRSNTHTTELQALQPKGCVAQGEGEAILSLSNAREKTGAKKPFPSLDKMVKKVIETGNKFEKEKVKRHFPSFSWVNAVVYAGYGVGFGVLLYAWKLHMPHAMMAGLIHLSMPMRTMLHFMYAHIPSMVAFLICLMPIIVMAFMHFNKYQTILKQHNLPYAVVDASDAQHFARWLDCPYAKHMQSSELRTMVQISPEAMGDHRIGVVNQGGKVRWIDPNHTIKNASDRRLVDVWSKHASALASVGCRIQMHVNASSTPEQQISALEDGLNQAKAMVEDMIPNACQVGAG